MCKRLLNNKDLLSIVLDSSLNSISQIKKHKPCGSRGNNANLKTGKGNILTISVMYKVILPIEIFQNLFLAQYEDFLIQFRKLTENLILP